MRIYELAKQYNLNSKEIITILEKHGVEVKSHMSVADEQTIKLLEKLLRPESKTQKSPIPEAYSPQVEKQKKEVQNNAPVEAPKIKTVDITPIKTKTELDSVKKQISQVQKSELERAQKEESKYIQKTSQPSIDTEKTQKAAVPLTPSTAQDSFVVTATDMTVEQLAEQTGQSASAIILMLLKWGIVTAKNQVVRKATVIRVAEALGLSLATESQRIASKTVQKHVITQRAGAVLQERAPVVVVIGHVDHGKTTLLDFIRKTKVALKEKGGITQHLGAYEAVTANNEKIVFLDTPGHEAFSKIRQRGVRIADIVILVVAADDGVRPQTIEAIKVAMGMQAPIIVALNKIDKVTPARQEEVKQQLMQHGVVSEEWGGNAIFVPISAKLGTNVDLLLEVIVLQAHMMELRADAEGEARGFILEAKIEKGRGAVATVILQGGILRRGDYFIVGATGGRVTALIDSFNAVRTQVGASVPVRVSGFDQLPDVGEQLIGVPKETYLKHKVVQKREPVSAQSHLIGDTTAYKVILRADTNSSREALIDALLRVAREQERSIVIVASEVGDVSENDVELAYNTGSVIYVLHSKVDSKAALLAQKRHVQIESYDIIYRLLESVIQRLESEKQVKVEKVKVGQANVIKVFQIKKVGTVAGCYVSTGRCVKGGSLIAYRGQEKIGEGQIRSLQREKESVGEVRAGYECGIVLEGQGIEWQEGDRIECFIEQESSRQ